MKIRKTPERMCIGCQQMKPKKELIRIVRTPESEIVVDTTGKKAGRGAYICVNADCFQQAMKGKKLDRALKETITTEVYENLKGRLGLS